MKPGKKNPLSCICTTLAVSHPGLRGTELGCTLRSMKAIFPLSSTPIAPVVHISSSFNDVECTNGPRYIVLSNDMMADKGGYNHSRSPMSAGQVRRNPARLVSMMGIGKRNSSTRKRIMDVCLILIFNERLSA